MIVYMVVRHYANEGYGLPELATSSEVKAEECRQALEDRIEASDSWYESIEVIELELEEFMNEI